MNTKEMIRGIVQRAGTQAAAGALLGLPQPRISAILSSDDPQVEGPTMVAIGNVIRDLTIRAAWLDRWFILAGSNLIDAGFDIMGDRPEGHLIQTEREINLSGYGVNRCPDVLLARDLVPFGRAREQVTRDYLDRTFLPTGDIVAFVKMIDATRFNVITFEVDDGRPKRSSIPGLDPLVDGGRAHQTEAGA